MLNLIRLLVFVLPPMYNVANERHLGAWCQDAVIIDHLLCLIRCSEPCRSRDPLDSFTPDKLLQLQAWPLRDLVAALLQNTRLGEDHISYPSGGFLHGQVAFTKSCNRRHA